MLSVSEYFSVILLSKLDCLCVIATVDNWTEPERVTLTGRLILYTFITTFFFH